MFSFHATKIFHTIEGGALCFNDCGLTEQINDIKDFGIRAKETVSYAGGNAKMNEFQAAMGLCNLRHLNEEIEKRKKIVQRYRNRLSGIKGIKLCNEQKNVESNYAYMPVVFDTYKLDRDEIYHKLSTKEIESRKYFFPLTCDFDYSKRYPRGKLEVASHISNHILTLPLYGILGLEEVDYICDIILGD